MKDIIDNQLNEIFVLKQEIIKQKEEIKHLEKLLFESTSIISKDVQISNEEFIALNELKKLKLKSEKEELTYEDAKRVELYYKVLSSIRRPDEKNNSQLKKLSTDDLLAQVDVTFGTK